MKKDMNAQDKLRFLKAYDEFLTRHSKASLIQPVLAGDETRVEAVYEVPSSLNDRELHEYMEEINPIGHAEITVDKNHRPIKFVFASLMDETLGWLITSKDLIKKSKEALKTASEAKFEPKGE